MHELNPTTNTFDVTESLIGFLRDMDVELPFVGTVPVQQEINGVVKNVPSRALVLQPDSLFSVIINNRKYDVSADVEVILKSYRYSHFDPSSQSARVSPVLRDGVVYLLDPENKYPSPVFGWRPGFNHSTGQAMLTDVELAIDAYVAKTRPPFIQPPNYALLERWTRAATPSEEPELPPEIVEEDFDGEEAEVPLLDSSDLCYAVGPGPVELIIARCGPHVEIVEGKAHQVRIRPPERLALRHDDIEVDGASITLNVSMHPSLSRGNIVIEVPPGKASVRILGKATRVLVRAELEELEVAKSASGHIVANKLGHLHAEVKKVIVDVGATRTALVRFSEDRARVAMVSIGTSKFSAPFVESGIQSPFVSITENGRGEPEIEMRGVESSKRSQIVVESVHGQGLDTGPGFHGL